VLVRQADGRARRVPVEVLGRRGDQVAVRAEIADGASVVVAGGYNVADGVELIEQAAVPAPAPGGDDGKDAGKHEAKEKK
jgi:hypothetical protein